MTKTIPVISGREFWIVSAAYDPHSRRVYDFKPSKLGGNVNTLVIHVAEVSASIQLDDLRLLLDALKLVKCPCDLRERLSGHLTECFNPEVEEALTTFREKYSKLLNEGE